MRQFTGKERDAEMGLDYFGPRYFSAAQGRFTSPDPFNIILDAESREQFDDYLAQPQNWNRYAYTWNNPLRYIDPTGEAVELLGDEEQRKKELELLQRALGNRQAGSRLYINEVKDGNKTRYFVGIKGDAGHLAKMGGAAQNLANLVQHKRVVEFGLTSQNLARFGGAVTFEPGEAGNQNSRVLVNPNQINITNYNLSPNSVLGASRWEGQNLRPSWVVRNFNPEISTWHELGHAWGYINGRPMSQTNAEALGWENQMRERFYGPLGPYNARRIRH